MSTLCLSAVDLQELTGYEQPARQLQALKGAGFWRARMNAMHEVVLERAHYEAVCAGATEGHTLERPKLRAIA
jgi:hypothetical protein